MVLKDAGVPVETELRPGLVHSIDQVGAQKGALFLRRCFGPLPATSDDNQVKSTGWRAHFQHLVFSPRPLAIGIV